MFDYMDGVKQDMAKMKTHWKDDLFFGVKLAQRRLSKYHADVTPWTGMLLILAYIPDPVQRVQLFRKWDQGMHIDPEEKTSYTTHYRDAFLKYVGNEYCAKHRCVPFRKPENIVSNNPIPSEPASGSGQSSFDPFDLSSDDKE